MPTTHSGHRHPWLADHAPQVELLSVTSTEAEIHDVQLVCRSCIDWNSPSFDVNTANQPWIWAANREQILRTDDKNASIDFHKDHLFGKK